MATFDRERAKAELGWDDKQIDAYLASPQAKADSARVAQSSPRAAPAVTAPKPSGPQRFDLYDYVDPGGIGGMGGPFEPAAFGRLPGEDQSRLAVEALRQYGQNAAGTIGVGALGLGAKTGLVGGAKWLAKSGSHPTINAIKDALGSRILGNANYQRFLDAVNNSGSREIRGNTYPVKEGLKRLGATWNKRKKAWLVPAKNADEARRMVEAGGARPQGFESAIESVLR